MRCEVLSSAPGRLAALQGEWFHASGRLAGLHDRNPYILTSYIVVYARDTPQGASSGPDFLKGAGTNLTPPWEF